MLEGWEAIVASKPDDESVIHIAELMTGDLAEIGILVQVTLYAGDLPAPGIAPVPRGQLVLQLTRQWN